MSTTVTPVETLTVACDLLTQIDALNDQLLALDLSGVGEDDALLGLLSEHEGQSRRGAAVSARMVAEVDARAVAWEKGFKSTAALLRDLLRVAPGEARARVRTAAQCGPRGERCRVGCWLPCSSMSRRRRRGAKSARHRRG